jgi:HAMP domain-containing protein
VFFAREVAASIGDRRELYNRARLERQISQIMGVRRSVLQLDVIAFRDATTDVVATSNPNTPLPFTPADGEQLRLGKIVSRLAVTDGARHWEIMAPVNIEDTVAGAVAVKFSFDRADALAARTRNWALALTAASVVVMGVLMTVAVHVAVNRPIQQFLDAIRRVEGGDQSAVVRVDTRDEFGVLANHFNQMMGRLKTFNEELQARVAEATAEAEERYREVERLHEALFRLQRSPGAGKAAVLRNASVGTEFAVGTVTIPIASSQEALVMKRVLGLTLAGLLALPLAASAEQTSGKIKEVDRAEHAFVLEDGTRLWLDEGRLADLREGERVLATYTTQDGKKVVTELEVRTVVDGAETTNLGGKTSFFDYKIIESSD